MKIVTPWLSYDCYEFAPRGSNFWGNPVRFCEYAFLRFFPGAKNHKDVRVVATTTYRANAKAIVLKGLSYPWGSNEINYSLYGSKKQSRQLSCGIGVYLKRHYRPIWNRLFINKKTVTLWMTLEIK